MRIQKPIGILALLAAMLFGSGSFAFGWNISLPFGWSQGRLARLAARQNLHDEVCAALADGVITPYEKAELLANARSTLSAEELPAFQRLIDRLCPPKKSANHSQTAKRTSAPTNKSQTTPPEGTSQSPVIPTGAVLPDRMVPETMIR
jgi:hypothetical protein